VDDSASVGWFPWNSSKSIIAGTAAGGRTFADPEKDILRRYRLRLQIVDTIGIRKIKGKPSFRLAFSKWWLPAVQFFR
jgi:hypothetical protein